MTPWCPQGSPVGPNSRRYCQFSTPELQCSAGPHRKVILGSRREDFGPSRGPSPPKCHLRPQVPYPQHTPPIHPAGSAPRTVKCRYFCVVFSPFWAPGIFPLPEDFLSHVKYTASCAQGRPDDPKLLPGQGCALVVRIHRLPGGCVAGRRDRSTAILGSWGWGRPPTDWTDLDLCHVGRPLHVAHLQLAVRK